jgi:hypothetical protein
VTGTEATALIEKLLERYDRLLAEIRVDLFLSRMWPLIAREEDSGERRA